MSDLSISVIVPTYNSSKTLPDLLKSIRSQDYDQKKIEIILSDGGSTDKTRSIGREYKAKIVDVNPKNLQSAEFNRAFGAHKASGDILAFFDHDNILPHEKILSKMTKPFLNERGLVGVETLYYQYKRNFSMLDRYFSLFGVNDPLPFYLGKADRQSYMFDDGYHLTGKAIDKGDYYLVKFSPDKIPTLGSNGFLIKRNLLMKNADVRVENFFHIDVNVDLIRKGFNKYAFVKDGIIHLSNHNDFVSYLWRRMLYMKKYHLQNREKRRYSVFERKDVAGLIVFIFLSMTFVKPLIDSIRGFIKIRDVAWFLHPLMCFGTLVVYGYTFLFYRK